MVKDTDDAFFDRADAVIHLANEQLAKITRGKVSASTMYATTRFNAWNSACGFSSSADMAAAREETVDYYTKQYVAMLEENLDDYIENFARYMQKKES